LASGGDLIFSTPSILNDITLNFSTLIFIIKIKINARDTEDCSVNESAMLAALIGTYVKVGGCQ
jgi:hypothetical protein